MAKEMKPHIWKRGVHPKHRRGISSWCTRCGLHLGGADPMPSHGCENEVDKLEKKLITKPKSKDVIEEMLDILHEVIPHTPLKLEQTNKTDYDKGYIDFQDLMLSHFWEVEKKLKEHYNQALTKAIQEARDDEQRIALKWQDKMVAKAIQARDKEWMHFLGINDEKWGCDECGGNICSHCIGHIKQFIKED